MKKTERTCGKKIFSVFVCLFFLSAAIFPQSETGAEIKAAEEPASEKMADSSKESVPLDVSEKMNGSKKIVIYDTDEQKRILSSKSGFVKNNTNFVFSLGPVIYINADKESAPSPVMCGAGFGAEFLKLKKVNLRTKLTFFTNYYGWDGTAARPSEVENRTSLVLSLLLDFDGMYSWYFKKCELQTGAGISFFGRYALLANGLNSSESGTSLSAGEETRLINKSFYRGVSFLYPNFSVCCYPFRGNFWKGGFEAKFYVPLQSLIDGNALDAGIVSLSFKLSTM